MLALLRPPLKIRSWTSTFMASPSMPPRPKLSAWALPASSSKPESYHQSWSHCTVAKDWTMAAWLWVLSSAGSRVWS